MKFVLKIKMGNAAMLTCKDVRRALIDTTNRLQREFDESEGEPKSGVRGPVYDHNGQAVGEWTFKGKPISRSGHRSGHAGVD